LSRERCDVQVIRDKLPLPLEGCRSSDLSALATAQRQARGEARRWMI
jgi:hypothetical protein